MKKRRRLKKWVRVTLWILGTLLLGGLFYLMISSSIDSMNEMYEQCDKAKGYTCSYYEARLYSIRGE